MLNIRSEVGRWEEESKQEQIKARTKIEKNKLKQGIIETK
jgi:hypothetical protein